MVERSRTNTPLQALVLMNDPNFLEAARALAKREMTEDREAGVRAMFRRVLAREPGAPELAQLLGLLVEQVGYFTEHEGQAVALVGEGETGSGVGGVDDGGECGPVPG